MFQYFSPSSKRKGYGTQWESKRKKKNLVCNNHTTSITCYDTSFKNYGVHFSLVLLMKDSFSQSEMSSQEKLNILNEDFSDLFGSLSVDSHSSY